MKNTSASPIFKITFRATEPGIMNTTIKNKYVRKENDFSSAERHPHTAIGLALGAPRKNLSASRRKSHLPQLLLFGPQSRPTLCDPWTAAHQAPLPSSVSRSLLKFMFTESVMPSNHLILCHPLLLLPSVFPTISVFSEESALRIR